MTSKPQSGPKIDTSQTQMTAMIALSLGVVTTLVYALRGLINVIEHDPEFWVRQVLKAQDDGDAPPANLEEAKLLLGSLEAVQLRAREAREMLNDIEENDGYVPEKYLRDGKFGGFCG
jgi:hypothetical protein